MPRAGPLSSRRMRRLRSRPWPTWPISAITKSRSRKTLENDFMIKLSFPFTEEKIRALKVGDEVLITGVVFTGRDAVHKYLHEGGQLPPGVNFRDGILYHCGP